MDDSAAGLFFKDAVTCEPRAITALLQTYQVSFWFMTDIAGGRFAVSWNGTQMLFVPRGVAFPYSLYQFATAHGTSSTLQFDATTPPIDPGADTW